MASVAAVVACTAGLNARCTDLDGASRWVDPQERSNPDSVALAVDDGEEHGILAAGDALQPGAIRSDAVEGAVGQVGPHSAPLVRPVGPVQVISVEGRVQWL